jgi:hypothetical protein
MNRDELLERAAPRTKIVDVPEWGGVTVELRQMGVREIEILQRELDKVESQHALIVVLSVIGSDGKLMFGMGDMDAVCRLPGKGTIRVAAEALQLSRIGELAEDAAKNS